MSESIQAPKVKHKGSNLFFTVIFAILFFLLVIIIINSQQIIEFFLKNKTSPILEETIPEKIVVIEPWKNQTLLEPSLPSLEELHEKYSKLVNSVSTRDYEAFKQVACRETMWNAENNPLPIGGLSETGDFIYKVGSPRGEKHFQELAPGQRPFSIPQDITVYIPTKVDWFNENFPTEEKRHDYILIDDFGKKTKIIKNRWQYAVRIFYEIKDLEKSVYQINDPQTDYQGYVIFVYDDGEWKYFREEWNIKLAAGVTIGETEASGKEVVIRKNGQGEYFPRIVNLDRGDKLFFQDITGVIMSKSMNNTWNSPFLHGQNFVKVFKDSGQYQYAIQFIDNIFYGTVIVN